MKVGAKSKRPVSRRVGSVRAGVMAAAAAAACSAWTASGANKAYVGSALVGNWGTGSNWSPSGQPVAGDVVTIARSGDLYVDYGPVVNGAALGSLSINGAGGGYASLTIDDALTLTTSNLIVATTGTAEVMGGSLNVNGSGTNGLYVGFSAGSDGLYALGIGAAGNLNVATNLYLGYSGSGRFVQFDGNTTVAGSLVIAANAGSTGDFSLHGGSLTSGTIRLNAGGELSTDAGTTLSFRSFVQTGGVHTAKVLTVDRADGVAPEYLMSGGQLYAQTDLNVGDRTAAKFVHTGGRVSASQFLQIGSLTNATRPAGSYALSGSGDVWAKELNISNGTFTQSGGTSFASICWVGTDNLALPNGASPRFVLTDGNCGSGSLYIGSPGTNAGPGTYFPTFIQSGGVNIVADTLQIQGNVGQVASYELSGGTLFAKKEFIGLAATVARSRFVQTGGEHYVLDKMTVSSGGEYQISGGALYPQSLIVFGSLNQTGGKVQSAKASTVYGRYTLGGTGGASFDTSWLTVDLSGVVEVQAGELWVNSGTNRGSGRLEIGSSSTGQAKMKLAGGQVFAGTVDVGNPGVGTLEQTGGTLNVHGSVRVGGDWSGVNRGTYILAGGTVVAGQFEIAPRDALLASGGGVIKTRNIVSSGAVTVTGPARFEGGLELAPLPSAVLNIDGGALTITGRLTLSGNAVAGANGGALLLPARSSVVGGGTFTVPVVSNLGSISFNADTTVASRLVNGPGASLWVFRSDNGQPVDASIAQELRNDGTIDVMDGGTLRLNSGVDGAGTVTVGEIGSVRAAYFRQDALTLSSMSASRASWATAAVLPRAQGGRTSRLKSLDFTFPDTPSAQLDLADNALVIDYEPSGPSPAAVVRAAIASGYAGGAWDGPGVVTSAAAGAAGGRSMGLGYAEAATALGLTGAGQATWEGEAVDASSFLVRFTLLGDANLDGAVNFTDLVSLAQNYNVADGVRTWSTGDFTYDGVTDFGDLVALAQNYNGTTPGAAAAWAGGAEFAADLSAAFASVPEPGGVWVAVAAAAALRRRRSPLRAPDPERG